MQHREPFGKKALTWIDRFGVYLSQRAIKKYLPQNQALDILDLGCGYEAKLLVTLQKHIKKGVGVDYQVHEEVKKISTFSFVESSIEQAIDQLHPASFNTIMLISILEHLQNPAEILHKCSKLLRPGGVLLINVPTWRGKFFLEFSAFKLGTSPKAEMDDHKMYYDKRDLWPLLVAAGFKPSQIQLKYHKFGLNLFAVATKLH